MEIESLNKFTKKIAGAGLAVGFTLSLASSPIYAQSADAGQPKIGVVPSVDARSQLQSWDQEKVDPMSHKSQIMDLALNNFIDKFHYDPKAAQLLRNEIVFMDADAYAQKSAADCGNPNPDTSKEAWLMAVTESKLYVNNGVTPDVNLTNADIFYNYNVGLFNIAPILKANPVQWTMPDGVKAQYLKGALLVAATVGDGLSGSEQFQLQRKSGNGCFNLYRLPIHTALAKNASQDMMADMGLPISDEMKKYRFNQDAIDMREKILNPYFQGSTAPLMQAFLNSDGGSLYQIIGLHLTDSKNPIDQQAAADKLLREMYPSGYMPQSEY